MCVAPTYVRYTQEMLEFCPIKIEIATVIGFPLGYSTSSTKLREAENALHDGATELDAVMNIAQFKSMAYLSVREELRQLADLAHAGGSLLKVIIETAYLDQFELQTACEICVEANVDFVKTSTGFAPTGADLATVALLRELLPESVQIKASGGIRTRTQALAFIAAGASRLGTSAGSSSNDGSMKRVLLLSTVHPSADPRIVYKIAPSLARHYTVFLALPGLSSPGPAKVSAVIKLPQFRRLLSRLLFCHPVVLWKCLRLRPDVVHIFVPELIPIAFLFRFLGAQVIYEVQENLYKKFSLKRYNNEYFFRYFFRIFDHLARRYFYCIFTEDAYLKEYRKLRYPAAVVHNYAALPFLDSLSVPSTGTRRFPFFYLQWCHFSRKVIRHADSRLVPAD